MATKSEWEITTEIRSWRMMLTWSLCTSFSKFKSRTLTSTGKKIIKIHLIYREQLQNNANKGSYFLKVDMDDLNNFDEQLALTLRSYPSDYIPVVRHKKVEINPFSLKKQCNKCTRLTISVSSSKKETLYLSSKFKFTVMRILVCLEICKATSLGSWL